MHISYLNTNRVTSSVFQLSELARVQTNCNIFVALKHLRNTDEVSHELEEMKVNVSSS